MLVRVGLIDACLLYRFFAVHVSGAVHVEQVSAFRYFSGTATYAKSVDARREWFRVGERTLLDLGTVADMAEVVVNGRSLGLLWKPPYRIDVTDALRAGRNHLAITITNQWTNRIIGDRIAPADRRVLSAVPGGRGGAPDPPLSGLLGPVTVVLQSERDVR